MALNAAATATYVALLTRVAGLQGLALTLHEEEITEAALVLRSSCRGKRGTILCVEG